MNKTKSIPLFCLILGLAAGVLRGIQLTRGYETETNLPVPHDPLLTVLVVLTLVFAGILLIWSRKIKGVEGLDFVQSFRCVNSGYKTISVLCGALLLLCGAGGIYFTLLHPVQQTTVVVNVYAQMQAIPNMILWILFLAAGVSLVGITALQSKIEVNSENGFWLVLPMFWGAFLLIVCYLDHASVPSESLFAFQLFACIGVMCGFYQMAGFLYAKAKIWGFLFWSGCASYFCMMEAVSHLWNFFVGGNSMELTLLSGLKLIGLVLGGVFLFCNQYILLSNLAYQRTVAKPENIEA